MTKSAQSGMNFSLCSGVKADHQDFSTQDASGERSALLGRVNPVEESKASPSSVC